MTDSLKPQLSRSLSASSQDGGRQWARLSPDDGYKYNDVEISQEGMLTEPMSFPPAGSSPSAGSPLAPPTESLPSPTLAKSVDDQALGFANTVPYKPFIGQRPAGHRWAKAPDVEKGIISEEPSSADGQEKEGPTGSQNPGKQSSGSRPKPQKESDVRYIKLDWTMADDKLLLKVGLSKPEPQEAELPKRVLWR